MSSLSAKNRRNAVRQLGALLIVFATALEADHCPIWWLPLLLIGLICLALAVSAYFQGPAPRRGHF